jgi:hypothetical protein
MAILFKKRALAAILAFACGGVFPIQAWAQASVSATPSINFTAGVACPVNGMLSYNSTNILTCTSGVWTITGGGGVTGSGSTGYDAIWTSPTAIGTGLIYESGGKVGIGTTVPTANLQL